ncbi:TerC/Alx family metal homeostasis membrane protein [Nocardioides dongkuii]|uniref:TerC/Alx family metal homeostasis membrane protein n=1 Tax=Nocardioides dongkuii TaxID=2760089 RepID=UPI0015FD7DBC|nr:TerC/Alx family metal homeostasis membrane protein [Nocardioides dongkuii]
MDVPVSIWIVTVGCAAAFVVLDFYSHVRSPHEPTLRESGTWSAFYIGLALIFGVYVGLHYGWTFGGEYFAGYATEKALSVDNLFVFLMLMTQFGVPRALQQKALLFGIAIALAVRTVMILIGVAVINAFSWVFYPLGALLLLLAVRQLRPRDRESHTNSRGIRLLRRVVPVTDEYDGDRLSVRRDGRRMATPLLVVVFALGLTDIVFALDSIPAVFGLTTEGYLVFAANAFSLLGLRQLYFLIGHLLERLVYLGVGLSAILAFIGLRLINHALHANEVSFINGGHGVHLVPEVPIWASLSFIAVTLTIVTVASLSRTSGTDPDRDGGAGLRTRDESATADRSTR